MRTRPTTARMTQAEWGDRRSSGENHTELRDRSRCDSRPRYRRIRPSGAAIERNAMAHGVKVIDYDRLTLHGAATYYVSFDPVKVGALQASSLVDCLKASGEYRKHPPVAELNGSPSDSNAPRVKRGY